jgi:hypothetical protein
MLVAVQLVLALGCRLGCAGSASRQIQCAATQQKIATATAQAMKPATFRMPALDERLITVAARGL